MSRPYTHILINDLCLPMLIGIHDQERAAKQDVLVSVRVECAPFDAGDISDTVDYEALVNKITALSQSKHYDLIEEFIEGVADLSLQSKQAQAVCVRVVKPDIIAAAGAVGVEIYRVK